MLEIYREGVFITKREGDATVRHPVSATDLIAALTDQPVSTGFLPRNVLFWQRQGGNERIAIFVSARRWRVTLNEARLRIPLPPLVFIGEATNYQVFALEKRPSLQQIATARLFNFPGSNVNASGSICRGNVPFPTASTETIDEALALFMSSGFNHDNSGNRCRSFESSVALWQALDGQKKFPFDELVSANARLRDLL